MIRGGFKLLLNFFHCMEKVGLLTLKLVLNLSLHHTHLGFISEITSKVPQGVYAEYLSQISLFNFLSYRISSRGDLLIVLYYLFYFLLLLFWLSCVTALEICDDLFIFDFLEVFFIIGSCYHFLHILLKLFKSSLS